MAGLVSSGGPRGAFVSCLSLSFWRWLGIFGIPLVACSSIMQLLGPSSHGCLPMYVLCVSVWPLFFSKLMTEFWPCWVFVAAHRFFPVAGSGVYSLGVALGLLIAVASVLLSTDSRAQQLQHMGSVVVVPGLSCLMACGIFLEQGLNLRPPALGHRGSPSVGLSYNDTSH